jgi:dTDP-4-dehydrorhamnose 3,5-epimerase
MIFEEQNIKGIFKVTLSPYIDNRGAFSRLFCEEEFAQAGIPFSCKQINQSFTKEKGSFRGIHYQFGAFAEWKLIRCIQGSVLDFGVDLRKNSSTLYKSFSIELTEDNHTMLLLPPGVGHAFQTLEENTTLVYFHSSFYNSKYEGGIKFDDPKIQLNLPLEITNLSERDKNHPLINTDFTGIDYEM